MGESVAEATLTAWLKEVGETIDMDEAVFEIATDKVDSEVPSEVEGILVEKRFDIDDVVKVGDIVAVIEVNGEMASATEAPENVVEVSENDVETEIGEGVVSELKNNIAEAKEIITAPVLDLANNGDTTERFYSPLVKNIAKQEGIPTTELDTIQGSGKEGRVTKKDILAYVENRKAGISTPPVQESASQNISEEKVTEQPTVQQPIEEIKTPLQPHQITTVQSVGGDEVIEMTRMGKLIAKHMVNSVSTSAHVQSFIEVDVTDIVNWRNKMKDSFEQREGEKLTFTPIFLEAVAKALKKYPLMNISVDGEKIIKKKNINIGMAAALPDGNLIVPVIKNADQLNLVGMAKVVNDLANRARNNALKPDEIQDGTYTVTNVGTFGSVFGTPIINQPQVGILALGAIRKMPAVIETAEGDFIGIRHKMYISHSYDHRVVNGALGSMFAKAVADYLEDWDVNREV